MLGGHTLSGACLEPRALNELIPDWKEKGVRTRQKKVLSSLHRTNLSWQTQVGMYERHNNSWQTC